MIFPASWGKVEPLSQWHCVLKIQRISLPTPDVPKIISYKIYGVISASALIKVKEKIHLTDTTHNSKQFCTHPQKDHVGKHVTLLYFWEVVDIHHTFRTWPDVAHLEWMWNVSYRLTPLNFGCWMVVVLAKGTVGSETQLEGGGYWEWTLGL